MIEVGLAAALESLAKAVSILAVLLAYEFLIRPYLFGSRKGRNDHEME